MSHVRGDIYIDRSPAEVFDFVADERNEPLFNPSMISVALVTDEPIAAGSVFDATALSRGKPVPMTVRFTEFERPTRLCSQSRISGLTLTGGLTFTPEGGGTRMAWDWDVRAPGVLRLASPLISAAGRRQERRIWTALKSHLEGVHTAT